MPPRRARGGRTGGRGGRGGGRGSNNGSNDENPDIAAMIAAQLAALIPTIVTQVAGTMAGNGGSNNGEGENGNGGTGGGTGGGCTYKEFTACRPKEFDGKGGALAYTRWIEKMESVIDISNCADNQRIRYVTSSLSGKALTWWNTQMQARGRESALGMSWDEFKALMKEEYCPSNEMQKLENEFWSHVMVGAGHAAYTDRFHELAKLVPHLVTPESKRIERYIYGLVPQIRGMVAATDPPTIQSAILKAGSLTDEMVRNGTLSRNGDKRKEAGETSKAAGARVDNKKPRGGKGYVAADTGRKEYTGPLPKCAKCNYHHNVTAPCRACTKCNRMGHWAKDCRVGVRQVAPVNAVNPRACYECGSPDHYRYACPRLIRTPGQVANNPNQQLAIGGNNQNRGNNNNPARGRAFIMGANEARQDPNIVTGTFSLNDHYATVLFDSGADYSFVSTEFMPLLDTKPSIMNFS